MGNSPGVAPTQAPSKPLTTHEENALGRYFPPPYGPARLLLPTPPRLLQWTAPKYRKCMAKCIEIMHKFGAVTTVVSDTPGRDTR